MTAKRSLAVLGLGLASAQAGHLLAYQLRFGAAAQQVQAAGAHSYFPGLAKTGIGLASVAVIAAMCLVGVARVAAGRRLEPGSAPPFTRLLAVMYTVQLACFGVQETVEALAGGGHPMSAPLLLLWGTAGQLPVALAATLALRWLLGRVSPALAALRLPATPAYERAGLTLVLPALAFATRPVLARVVIADHPRRGPPSS
jgi:hypothetical protein